MVIIAKGPTVLKPTLKRLGGPTTAISRTLHINNVEITSPHLLKAGFTDSMLKNIKSQIKTQQTSPHVT